MTKTRWIWAAAALVLVVALIAVVASRSGDDSPSRAATEPTAASSEPVATPSSSPVTTEPAPTKSPKPGKPIGIEDTGTIDEGAKLTVEKIASVTSVGKGPGEVEGPAIQVTLRVKAGTSPVNLGDVAVNAYYGADRTPAVPMSGPGGDPLSGTVAARSTQDGVYVFNVPKGQRDKIEIEVFYEAAESPVVFQGSAT